MKSLVLIFILVATSGFSQAGGLSEMAMKRCMKENAKGNRDSVYFANHEFDSVKLTNAILAELNRVRRLNNSKNVVCMTDTTPCNYVMRWSKHLADTKSVGHGGAQLYKAEVAHGGCILRSEAESVEQYSIIARDTIQAFIDSPEHKRIILDSSYNQVVIGFAFYIGKYSALNTVIVIGFG